MAQVMVEVGTKPCIKCKKTSKVTVSTVGLSRYNSGVLIQQAFPELNNDEREMLITGIHPECWEEMFGGEEE